MCRCCIDLIIYTDYLIHFMNEYVQIIERNKLLIESRLEHDILEQEFLRCLFVVGDPCSSYKKGATLNQDPLFG